MRTALCADGQATKTTILLAQLQTFELTVTQEALRAILEHDMVLIRLPLQSFATHRTANKLRHGKMNFVL